MFTDTIRDTLAALRSAGASVSTVDGLHVAFDECASTSRDTLRHLFALSELTDVCFYDTPVDGAILAQLTCSDTLTSINLNCTSVSAHDLRLLTRFPRLQTIGLMDTPADDDCLEALLGCRDLWNLRIDGTQISPSGLKLLAVNLPIEVLWIGGRQLSLKSLQAVETHLELSELNVCGADVTDAAIPFFSALKTQPTSVDHTSLTKSGRQKMKRQYPRIHVHGT